jgi:hypothetical protein
MIRGLHRKTYVLEIGLSLLLAMAMVGCGGGGGGATVPPQNDNPVPAISTISPTSAAAGAAKQTLTINGTDFLSSSTVTYNSVAHTATFVSSTQLTIPLSASDQATAGSYAVVVTNPTPGGGASNAMNFTVNNPAPAISNLSPASATSGAAAQTLTIDGTNFLSTSTVTYNAAPHTATLVSATKLTIPLSANDQATAGNYPVVVTNPGPGGGASNSVNFVVNPGSSVVVTLNGSSSGTASETVGGSLPITASVTGATAALTFTVNGVTNGNSTFGTISGAYPNYSFLAPAAIPGNNNPVTIEATQGGSGQSASLAVTINPSTAAPNAITITGGNATGINFNLTSNSSLTLGLADVGTCSGASCSASVTGIEVSLSGQASASCPATCTMWLLGQGLTNAGGTAVASGLKVSVSGGSTPDVKVTSGSLTPLAPCSPSNPNCTSSVTFENITFQVVASASATLGVRNIVVTLGDGETQVYIGAIQIVP